MYAPRGFRPAQSPGPAEYSCSEYSVAHSYRPPRACGTMSHQDVSDNASLSSLLTDPDVTLDMPGDISSSPQPQPFEENSRRNGYHKSAPMIRRNTIGTENTQNTHPLSKYGQIGTRRELLKRTDWAEYRKKTLDYLQSGKGEWKREQLAESRPRRKEDVRYSTSHLQNQNGYCDKIIEREMERHGHVQRTMLKYEKDPRSSPLLLPTRPSTPTVPLYGDEFVQSSRRARLSRSRPNSRGPSTMDTTTTVINIPLQPEESPRERNVMSPSTHDPFVKQHPSQFAEDQFDQSDVRGSPRSVNTVYERRALFSPVPKTTVDRSGYRISRESPIEKSALMKREEDGHFTREEIYLIGSLRVPLSKFVETLHHFPPPLEYSQLRPIEKIAYIFYCALWQQNYSDINIFHNRFNKEFYTLTSEGFGDEEALYEICSRMQQRKAELKKEKEKENIVEHESNLPSESIHDCNPTNCPLKFSAPHSFLIFGPGGRLVVLDVSQSTSIVQICDVKGVLRDEETIRIVEAVQLFRGPLGNGSTTAPHSVNLFIRRHIDSLLNSDLARTNPIDNDFVHVLLVWKMLQMMVQQYGKVTGPDIARLLNESYVEDEERKEQLDPVPIVVHKERSIGPQKNSEEKRRTEVYTQYLMEGHIQEAIDFAIKHGMYSDAMLLARRVFPDKLIEVEEKYLEEMVDYSPVTTLIAVASGGRVPMLANCVVEDGCSWMSHVSIILANQSNQYAMDTVYSFGRVLAHKEYQSAADFCWLAVCLLANADPFKSPVSPSASSLSRQHISLIHASLSDDVDHTMCRYGFSLIDLFATEIFSYACSLSPSAVFPLSSSIDYQKLRIQHTKLLYHLGFTKNAYMYCLEIAQSIWAWYSLLPIEYLNDLCEIAERSHALSDTVLPIQWINDLRLMIDQLHSSQPRQQVNEPQQFAHHLEPFSNWMEQQMEPVGAVQNGAVPEQAQDVSVDQSSTPAPPPMCTITPSVSPFTVNDEKCEEGEEDTVKRCSSTTATSSKVSQSGHSTTTSSPEVCHGTEMSSSACVSEMESPRVHSHSPAVPIVSMDGAPLKDTVYPSIPHSNTVFTSPEVSSYRPPEMIHQNERDSNYQTRKQEYHSSIPPSSSLNSSSKGLFSRLRQKLVNAIPIGNEMRLPDDKNKTIVWDARLGRYVGDGMEEDTVPPPPPSLPLSLSHSAPTSIRPPTPLDGGLRNVRSMGGSRYLNPLSSSTLSASLSIPTTVPPPILSPPGLFIPSGQDSCDAASMSPFSTSMSPFSTVDTVATVDGETASDQ